MYHAEGSALHAWVKAWKFLALGYRLDVIGQATNMFHHPSEARFHIGILRDRKHSREVHLWVVKAVAESLDHNLIRLERQLLLTSIVDLSHGED